MTEEDDIRYFSVDTNGQIFCSDYGDPVPTNSYVHYLSGYPFTNFDEAVTTIDRVVFLYKELYDLAAEGRVPPFDRIKTRMKGKSDSWLEHVEKEDLMQLNELIEHWREQPADSEALKENGMPADAYEYAHELLFNGEYNTDSIDITEDENKGAFLEMDIDKANEICERDGLEIRFEETIDDDASREETSVAKRRCCTICDDDSCDHLVANFGITEANVGGGAIYERMREIRKLLVAAVSRDDKAIETHLFSELLAEIKSHVADSEVSADDAYSENFGIVIRALRDYFDGIGTVTSPGRYDVNEATGAWAYQNYWSADPKAVVNDLLTKLWVYAVGDASSTR